MSRYEQALNDYRAGEYARAVAGLQEVVNADPLHTPAHYHLGLALYQSGRIDEGIRHYRQLLKRHPDYLDAWINLGDLCGKAGQPESAITAWHQGLALDADSVLILNNLGVTCHAIGRHGEALQYFRQAAAIDPDRSDLWVWLGNIQMGMGKHAQAEKAYRQALRLSPSDAQVHNNLAVTLGNLGRVEESIAEYRAALALDADLADGLNNLALALHKRHESDEAETLLRRCTAKHPDYALGWANLGMVLQGIGKLDEAVKAIDRALVLTPNQAGWIWNQSLAFLTMGDFERGWQGFEARYAPDRGDANFTDPQLPFPMWQGEPLAGKRILLVKEQGFGDQIQCLRFAHDVKSQGAACVGIWVHPAMVGIVATTPGIDEVTIEASRDGYDYWAYLMSLPARLGVNEACLRDQAAPYVFPNAEKSALAGRHIENFAQGRKRVAINWAGNPSHPNDHNRSLPVDLLYRWLDLRDIAWISVQKDRPPATQTWLDTGALLPLGDAIHDFSDTAAILANVDLLITIDSAVAHLAGAMGVPTWLLLPANPDYRWMLDREDTPWYPSIRLWRQSGLEQWDTVMLQVAASLRPDENCDRHLTNAEIETLLLRENAILPEPHSTVATFQLEASPASAAAWGKWLLVAFFFFEFIMLMARR